MRTPHITGPLTLTGELASDLTLTQTGTATATTQYPSHELTLETSCWDTGAAAEVLGSWTLQTVGESGSGPAYRLAVVNHRGDELLTLDQDGRLGVGAPSPSAPVHLEGDVLVGSGFSLGIGTTDYGGGVLYCVNGALQYRGSAGTVTEIASA